MLRPVKESLYSVFNSHGWQVPVRIIVTLERWFSSYSYMGQEGQDKIVLKILKNKREGTFVELGASNGVTSSNSYVLENKYGWTGLLIEANKRFYKNLVKNRKSKMINTVVSDSNKEVLFNNDGCTGHIDDHGTEMKARPLSELFRKFEMPEIIDYLSLDVEGYEEEVLYNFLDDKYQFRVMSIERPSDKLHEKILSKGYELHTEIRPNGFWLDNIYVMPNLV